MKKKTTSKNKKVSKKNTKGKMITTKRGNKILKGGNVPEDCKNKIEKQIEAMALDVMDVCKLAGYEVMLGIRLPGRDGMPAKNLMAASIEPLSAITLFGTLMEQLGVGVTPIMAGSLPADLLEKLKNTTGSVSKCSHN